MASVARCGRSTDPNIVLVAFFHNHPPKQTLALPLLMQVVLHFTAPVSVDTTLGSPVLLLRVDPTTTDTDGIRSAEYIPGLTQFVDVGVDASR